MRNFKNSIKILRSLQTPIKTLVILTLLLPIPPASAAKRLCDLIRDKQIQKGKVLARAELNQILLAKRLAEFGPEGTRLEKDILFLTPERAEILIERIDRIELYSHSYALFVNRHHLGFSIHDHIEFAHQNGLQGINIHGSKDKLLNASPENLSKIRTHAANRGIKIQLEVSETNPNLVSSAIRASILLGCRNLRVYPIKTGRVSKIIDTTISDMKTIFSENGSLLDEHDITILLEQHEDLKSHELVRIVEAVGNSRLKLLYDYTNMFEANEHHLVSLRNMGPHIAAVHTNNVKLYKDRGGFGKIGVPTGEEGVINEMRMLYELLTLEQPIEAFALEEEIGYNAPAFRFPNEEADPIIPLRESSSTVVNGNIEEAAAAEYRHAVEQIKSTRRNLAMLRRLATDLR